MNILKIILCICSIPLLYKAIVKDNFDYLYDALDLMILAILIEPVI